MLPAGRTAYQRAAAKSSIGWRGLPVIVGLVRDVSIRGDTIRLGQGSSSRASSGPVGEARSLIEEGAVQVNGDVETRRGRQLRSGDVVALGSEVLRVA